MEENQLVKKQNSWKEYRTLQTNGNSLVSIKAEPNSLITSETNKDVIRHFFAMVSASASKPVPDSQKLLFYEAMKVHKITVEEAMQSFWEAYADPYQSGSGIEFRHLFKYISEKRNDIKDEFYTYEQVLAKIDKGALWSQFVCLNGKNGYKAEYFNNGKPKWKQIK